MKRILHTFVAVLLLSTNVFAASFEIDKNPDYRSSLIDSGNTNYASYKSTYADTQNPVTYDNKSAKIGNLFDNKWQDGYGFSWVTGASGKAEDWAPCITAVTNETSTIDVDDVLVNHGYDRDHSFSFDAAVNPQRDSEYHYYLTTNGKGLTTVDGIYAVGDISKYDNKVYLISGAFQDAINAINDIKLSLEPTADKFAKVSSHNEIFEARNREIRGKVHCPK